LPRKPKPSYVVELPLDSSPGDDRRLAGVLEAAKRLFNVVLQDGLAIVAAIRADAAWAAAKKLPQTTAEERSARGDALTAVRRAHGFSEYDFHALATRHKNAAGFSDRLGSHVTQKTASRVFKALEEHLFGRRGRPRFKGFNRPLHSIEGKNTAAAPRWDVEKHGVHLSKDWFIPAKPLRLHSDEWLWSALQGEVKYTRIVRRHVGQHVRYYVQLVMNGHAPMKASVAERLAECGTVGGLDIGPSTIAWCTETDAGLFTFCAEVDSPKRLLERLQRRLDRQRRANNPDNFDEQGRAKRGCSWTKSRRQVETEGRLRTLQSSLAERRNNAHGRDINNLLSKARSFRHDGVSVKSLQQNYGRSIGARAPGRFMSELQRKAERAGGSSTNIDSRQLKTSQYDHSNGTFTKKSLSERWHTFADGRGRVQRDVYSAFLALHATEGVDADGVIQPAHDPLKLEAAWQVLAPRLKEQELFFTD
jgi:putative transposase